MVAAVRRAHITLLVILYAKRFDSSSNLNPNVTPLPNTKKGERIAALSFCSARLVSG